MNKVYVTIQCLVLLLFSTVGMAQDFQKDLEKVRNTYGNHSFSTDIEIRLMKKGNLWLTKKAGIKKSGSDYWYRMDGIEMLFNRKMNIMVDHSRKGIIYDEMKKGETRIRKEVDGQLLGGVDSLAMGKWSHVGDSGGVRHYRMDDPGGIIIHADFYINIGSFMIERIFYEYNKSLSGEAMEVEVEYSGNRLDPTFDGHTFSERRYLKSKGGKWTASASMDGYSVYRAGEGM